MTPVIWLIIWCILGTIGSIVLGAYATGFAIATAEQTDSRTVSLGRVFTTILTFSFIGWTLLWVLLVITGATAISGEMA